MKNRSGIKPIRDSKGRIKEWPGGREIKNYPVKWQRNNQHGIRVHIGMEFKRQRKRSPRIGDTVRTKRKDGHYHKGAFWYIYTRYGWRVTTSQRKPTTATVKRICERARPTRRK